MSSTIGEPFQLYLGSTLSQKTSKREAIYSTVNRDFPGYATVTAQADGIHVWDLQNLHAVVSYSVSEHVRFATPAFSLFVMEDGSRSVISYTVLDSAPDIIRKNRRRTIWAIRQSLSGPGIRANEKTAVIVDHPPARICGSGHDVAPLLLVSKNGSFSLANIQVEIKTQLVWPGKRKHLETFVFSKKSCGFIKDDTGSCDNVAVTFCQSGMVLQVRLARLGEEIIPAGTCEIPIAGSANDTNPVIILGLTCSPSGILSFIDSRGIWTTYQLASLNDSLITTSVSENVYLRRFTFLKNKASTRSSFSIVSLDTSLVLLAALVEGTEDIFLQIWDLSYGVILAVFSMPVPPRLFPPCLSLTVAGDGQVLLTVSPSQRKVAKSRSSIYVVPVDSRLRSSLAGALGKMAQTVEWLSVTLNNSRSGSKDVSANIISNVQASLEKNNAQKAERIFLEWVESHSSQESALGHELVKRVFKMILVTDQPTKYPYTPRITRCLLENAVVSTIMFDGCLISALRQRGDWENVMFALTRVVDISEDELMASAKFLIDRERKSENTMDFDGSEGYVPPFWSYLSACISYSFSPAPMCLAIRRHLSDARDLVVVLEILENWIQGGTELEMEALLRSIGDSAKMLPDQCSSPPYPKTITFLQALLDASFVSLLQFQPSHDILHRILSHIQLEISFIDNLEPLRGMLGSFTNAHKTSASISNESQAERRRRAKQLEQRADLGVGLYRLEELVI